MLKKAIVLFVLVCVILPYSGVFAFASYEPNISAYAAVLMTADTRCVLYSRNADERLGMASTTKIMTSVVALEYASPDMSVTVNKEDALVEGTSIGLKEGDKISLLTLIKGMLLESGNDAANVVSTAVAGSNEAFCELMNEKARDLGMNNTSFDNPSGLPSENHYSTAYDMALLGAFAVSIPEFTEICSEKSERVSFGTPECECTFTNHNKLLSLYDGAFGIKTGFTKSSGRCLVSAAKRDGVTLIAVTLNAPDDWNDHIKLLDYGFEHIKKVRCLENSLKIPVAGIENKTVSVEAVPEYFTVGDGVRYTLDIYSESILFSPVKKGDAVGSVRIKDENGAVLGEALLISKESVDAPKQRGTEKKEKASFFKRIADYFKNKITDIKEKFN